jgi:hypothetical protein
MQKEETCCDPPEDDSSKAKVEFAPIKAPSITVTTSNLDVTPKTVTFSVRDKNKQNEQPRAQLKRYPMTYPEAHRPPPIIMEQEEIQRDDQERKMQELLDEENRLRYRKTNDLIKEDSTLIEQRTQLRSRVLEVFSDLKTDNTKARTELVKTPEFLDFVSDLFGLTGAPRDNDNNDMFQGMSGGQIIKH